LRKGGGKACCIGEIKKSEKTCQKEDDTACIMFCAGGVADGNVCCAKSCGTCGGHGCDLRKGGSAACCVGTIKSSSKVCGSPSEDSCVQEFETAGVVAVAERGLSTWSSAAVAGVALLLTLAGVSRWRRTGATAAMDGAAEQTPPLLE
jgi:hypothetical protein